MVVITNEQSTLFSHIKDASGTLFVNYNGQQVSFPIGFFLDSRLKRITALTANNDIINYGNQEGQYHFDTPVALTVVGDYLYVLDKGDADQIIIFKYGLNSDGGFVLSYVGSSDFGLNLQWVKDLTGFTMEAENILYVLNPNEDAIIRLSIEPNTGLVKNNEPTIKLKTYKNYNGRINRLSGIEKIEISPRNSTTGKNILMAIKSDNQLLSFSTDGLSTSTELNLNYKHSFPMGSGLVGIGYNVGNNTFNVVDLYKGKIHVLSSLGNYLGSGGSYGTSEENGELYRPNIISSNNFADDAIEMIVGSRWGLNTGLKRVFPKADIGKIEVIEKSPVAMEQVEDNMLMFRYALTAGNDVDYVRLKLNGEVIKEINSTFFPNVFSENFLVNGEGENGLKGKVKNGWNTFEIELTARIPGPVNGNLQYKRTKSMQFYFMPSIITTDNNFVIGNSSDADIMHSIENPFYLYKNMLVEGDGIFSISGGKIILMKGCTLKIAKERRLFATNERFELMCGANIEVNTQEEIPKVFKEVNFNGLNSNYNIISCRGDYTGGLGAGSAPSSMMEFISCSFENYLGKAIHLIEGRSTVANCTFNPKQGFGMATAAAIAADPLTRLDVRGGEYRNNDIAIDGNGADLYIGRAATEYKDVPITNTVFENNTIALHTFSGYTEIQYTDFRNNTIAIIDLNGTLDIALNSNNTFAENVQGIVFSNVLIGETGKNKFINNNVDITYLVPDGEIEPTEINLSCNYWKHDVVEGTPVIDIISDPEYDPNSELILFETQPFLVQNGNSGNYTCTGGKGKNGRYAESEIIPMQSTLYHTEFLQTMDGINGKEDTYSDLAIQVSQTDGLKLSDYTRDESLIFSLENALIKNGIFAYLYRSYKAENVTINQNNYKEAYQILADGFTHHNHYVGITRDKLAFAVLLLKDKRKVDAPVFIEPKFGENKYMVVYPNPTRGLASISVNVPSSNNYTIELFNNNGTKMATVIENKVYEMNNYYSIDIDLQNYTPGLYFIKLYSADNEINQTLKLLKQ